MTDDRREYAESIKQRIKKLIDWYAKGKLTKFGEVIGVDYRTVGNWTKEKNAIPRADQIDVICEKLKINPKWLLQGEGELQDRLTSQKEVWSVLWESDPDYFSERLVELHKAVLMKKIEEQTKGGSKQLAPVMAVLEDLVAEWTETCEQWLAKIKKLEQDPVEGEHITVSFDTWSVGMSKETKYEDGGVGYISFIDDSIRELRKKMDDYESKIDTLLRVYEEEKDGNTN